MTQSRKKLAVDFGADSDLRVPGGLPVDDDTRELIRSMCTRAGMIMEDASAPAVCCMTLDDASLRMLVDLLTRRLDDARCLILAATRLLESGATSGDQLR